MLATYLIIYLSRDSQLLFFITELKHKTVENLHFKSNNNATHTNTNVFLQ